MAVNEGIRKTSEAFVVSECPDMCHTPIGAKKVLVPYEIIAILSDARNTTPTVFLRDKEAFTTVSWIQGVKGNEAGTGGGVVSGVFAGGGISRPVPGTESQFVTAENHLVVYHTTKMEMNAPTPGARGNTTGRCVYQSCHSTVTVDKDGKVKGDTNPKDKPENEEELKTKVREPDKEHKLTEAKSEGGIDQGDRADTYKRGSSLKPEDGAAKLKQETSFKLEKKTFDASVIETDDGSLKVGNLTGSRYWGAGYDNTEGVYKAGLGAEGGFTTIKGSANGSALGGFGTGNVDAELLSAKGSIGAEATFGKGTASVGAKAGAEVIVAEATAKAALRITGKTIWDNTVGALIKSMPNNVYNPLLSMAEAPKSWDKGIEVGASGTIGVGAAAEVSGKVGYDKNAPPGEKKIGAEWGAKLGLGPKAGIKSFLNIVF